MKENTDFFNFDALDVRVGRIVSVEDASTRKPTYRMMIDFGSEIGTKVSCGAYKNYAKDELEGTQIIAVINMGTKKMGPEISEVLVLGVCNKEGETIYIKPESEVELGEQVF